MAVIRAYCWHLVVISLGVTLTVYIMVISDQLAFFPQFKNDVKTIYVWDRPEWLFMKMGPSVEEFRKLQCEISGCRLVDRRSYPEEKLHGADSILFTIRDFYAERPERTNPDQIWVLWIRETPLHYYPIDLDSLNDVFNLTFTYLNDSRTDIYSPIGKIIRRPTARRYHPRNVEFVR